MLVQCQVSHQGLEAFVLVFELAQPVQFGDAHPGKLAFPAIECLLGMPSFRQASATDVPLSTRRSVAVICALVKDFFMDWNLLEGQFGNCPLLTFQVVQFLGDESI